MEYFEGQITDFISRAKQKIVELELELVSRGTYLPKWKRTTNEDIIFKLAVAVDHLEGDNDYTLEEKLAIINYLNGLGDLLAFSFVASNGLPPEDGGNGGGGGGGPSGPIRHNSTTEKQGGSVSLDEFYHNDKAMYDFIRGLMFHAPTINFPNVSFGSVSNAGRSIANDGAEKGTTFNYNVDVTIVPNDGTIQNIKVFKTTGGVENPTPIVDGTTLAFNITSTFTDTGSYRLQLTYTNTSGQTIVVNVVRTVPFYYPTFIGVGATGIDESTVKATLEKHIWVNADRKLIAFIVNSNKMYYIEKSGNTRRIVDVAINYTNSFTYTLVDYTFGSDLIEMKVAEFNNILVPGTYDFDFLLS